MKFVILCLLFLLGVSISEICDFHRGMMYPVAQVQNCLDKIPLNVEAALHDIKFFETMASVYIFRDYMRDTDSIKCKSDAYRAADYGIKVDILNELRIIRERVATQGYTSDHAFYSDIFMAFAKLKDPHTKTYMPQGYDFSMKTAFGLSISLSVDKKMQYILQTREYYEPLFQYAGYNVLRINDMDPGLYLEKLANNYCAYSMDHGACFNYVVRNDFESKNTYITPKGIDVNGLDISLRLELFGNGTTIAVEVPNLVYARTPKSGSADEYWKKYVDSKTRAGRQMTSNDIFQDEENLILPFLSKEEQFQRATMFQKKEMMQIELKQNIAFPISQKFMDKIKGMKFDEATREFERKNLNFSKKMTTKRLNAVQQNAIKSRAAEETHKILEVYSFKYTASSYLRFSMLQNGDDNTDIGVVEISSFNFGDDDSLVAREFKKGMNLLIKTGAKKIVVETRRNGGGSPVLAMSMAKQLSPGLPPLQRLFPAMDFVHSPTKEVNGDDYTDDQYASYKNAMPYIYVSAGYGPGLGYVTLNDPTTLMNPRGMLQGVQMTINNKKSMHSPLFTTGVFLEEIVLDKSFTPSDVIILTDGSCGSACGAFLTLLQYTNNAKVVSMGGNYNKNYISDTKSNIATASFKGASVFESTDLADYNNNYYVHTACGDKCPADSSVLTPMSNAAGRWGRYTKYAWDNKNLFRRDKYVQTECLNEFTKRDADFHLWSWDLSLSNVETYFQAAEFFGKCATWEHKPVAFSAKCGNLIEHGVYGQKCKDDATFDENSCEFFRCENGYFFDEGVCKPVKTPKRDNPKPNSAHSNFQISVILIISAIVSLFL